MFDFQLGTCGRASRTSKTGITFAFTGCGVADAVAVARLRGNAVHAVRKAEIVGAAGTTGGIASELRGANAGAVCGVAGAMTGAGHGGETERASRGIEMVQWAGQRGRGRGCGRGRGRGCGRGGGRGRGR